MKHVCLLLSASVGSLSAGDEQLSYLSTFLGCEILSCNSIWDYQKAQIV
jgi:hypothetical protein